LKNLVTAIAFLLLSTIGSFSQCFTTNTAFQPGERITYNVVYNWGFIWIGAGDVVFSVGQSEYKGHPVYAVEAHGTSYKSYDWFFKVRDTFEAYIDKQTLQPLWHRKNTSEGGYDSFEEYTFNYKRNEIYAATETSKRSYKTDTLRSENCTFDVLSMVYYARNFDFSGLSSGDKIPVTVLLDNEIYHLYVRYLGRELLDTKDGSQYRTIKFSVKLVEGTVFKGDEDLSVWVTDDKNHVPILVEAKILVGSVKALLRSTENLRNKSTAKTK
jgi:hypothetical protein